VNHDLDLQAWPPLGLSQAVLAIKAKVAARVRPYALTAHCRLPTANFRLTNAQCRRS
jgi:hypothetical protein